MRLYPHAKINLSLYITGRRKDGYHTLDTVFQPVSLFDELEAETAPELSFSCSEKALETADNLVLKAWRLMAARGDVPALRMRLIKNIPYEAGLGGGSADAAAVLKACAALSGGEIPGEELAAAGAPLGADVPAQLLDCPSRGHGTGTVLRPLESRARLPLLIAKPALSLSTPAMYRAWDEQGLITLPPKERISRQRRLERALKRGDARAVSACLYNDFERVLPPEAAEATEELQRKMKENAALGALLCGSGSAVFGLFAEEAACRRAAERLAGARPGKLRLFVCRMLDAPAKEARNE